MVRALASVAFVAFLSVAAFGQSAAPKPAFLSADVHTVPLSALGNFMSGGVLRAARYEVHSATMVDLIRLAYGVDDERILGGPSWLETDRFDVVATAPEGATADSAKLMLQALLADRFALALHNDSRPVPVYVLSVGKGNKMKPASGSGAPGCQGQPQSPPAPGTIPSVVVSCHSIGMDTFADTIHQIANGYLDHAVLNQTKLAGDWDFDLSWTPRGALAAAGPDGVSLFDAVDRQLGLKIEAQKSPMPVLVVEKANQKPTANLAGVGAAEGPLEFDAADIKLSAPGAQGFRFIYQPGGRVNGEGTLADLIGAALGTAPNLRADTVVGLPKFADSARYNIIAKLPATGAGAATHDGTRDTPPPLSIALDMLRNMFVERFKLKTHTENQSVSVYVLTVDKGGPKIKKADDTERASCKPDPTAAPAGANATPTNAMRCQNTTMEELAKNLPNWAGAYFDHPAVDATGLAGGYDFTLAWTPRGALHPARPGVTGGGAAVDPGGLSVFEAAEKQLGLKLDVQKRTMPVIVIDHLEEKPTED